MSTISDCSLYLLAFTKSEIAWVTGFAAACVLIVLWPLIRLLVSRWSRQGRAEVRADHPGRAAFVTAVLALLLFQCAFFAAKDSPTYDEPNHIASGYSYLATGDFRMSLAQPPVARMLMALPLLPARPSLNLNSESWKQADDWTFAREFLFHSGNDADAIVFWARFPIALLCVLLGFFVFKWARELYGFRAACFSLLLYSFSPNILAHGRLATTETPLACFGFISAYYFWKLMKSPGWRNALLSALFLGLALSAKYSGLMFGISFVLIAIVWGVLIRGSVPALQTGLGAPTSPSHRVRESGRNPGAGRTGRLREESTALKTLVAFCLIVLVVGLLIALLSSGLDMKPVMEYPAVQAKIAQFGEEGVFVFGSPALGSMAKNLASSLPMPRYLVGVLFNHFHFKRGHMAYLHGEWKLKGWWYYFPVAFLLKEPLPLLLLILLAACTGIRETFSARRRRGAASSTPSGQPGRCAAELVLFAIPVVSLLWSMAFVRLNIGFRHIVFLLPFIYVLLGRVLRSDTPEPEAGTIPFVASSPGQRPASPQNLARSSREWFRPSFVFAAAMLLWFCMESALTSPHHLAYFNELAGGPKGGVNWLVDSNLDWGQDLKRLRDYVGRNKVESLRLAYFGTADPSYYGIQSKPLTVQDFQNLEDSELFAEYAGERWALSVTNYAAFVRQAPWLKKIAGEEDARIGFSIFIFRPERLRHVLFPGVDLEARVRTDDPAGKKTHAESVPAHFKYRSNQFTYLVSMSRL